VVPVFCESKDVNRQYLGDISAESSKILLFGRFRFEVSGSRVPSHRAPVGVLGAESSHADQQSDAARK